MRKNHPFTAHFGTFVNYFAKTTTVSIGSFHTNYIIFRNVFKNLFKEQNFMEVKVENLLEFSSFNLESH
jgi:hypothetical protein